MRILLMVVLLSSVASAHAADAPEVAYPTLPAQVQAAAGFVPPHWSLERVVQGDLDGDKRDDLLMVLRMNDAHNRIDNADGLGPDPFDTNPRLLAIAFADGAGYRLAVQDHALIPRPDSPVMDDYLDGPDAVAIVRGSARISLHAWASAGSWGTSETRFTFRWQGGCFRLIGYDREELQRNSGETTTTSVNYLSSKVRIDSGSIEDETMAQTHWRKLPVRTPTCLQEVGDGFGFDPGVPDETSGE